MDIGDAPSPGVPEVPTHSAPLGRNAETVAIEEVYGLLRRIAQEHMSRERGSHTLQATALVHEAFLRLQAGGVAGLDRSQFLAACVESMRRILIEHARARGRLKRGGDRARLIVDIAGVADLAQDTTEDEVMALEGCIDRLQALDGRLAELVRLRFYAGLTIEQAAEAMEISPRTAKRDWAYARAWMRDYLSGGGPETASRG